MKLVKQLIARKLLAVAGPTVAVVILGTGMLLVIVTAAVGSKPEALPGLCVSDGNLEPILATIRQMESGNDYQAQAAGASASGAYQIVNGTWDGYGGYSRARDAPPEVQDAKAAEMVKAILDTYRDVSYVPVGWYLPSALDDGPGGWNFVPMPEAGNTLTIAQYQQKWLAEYQRQGSTAGAARSGSICAAFAAVGNYNGPLVPGLTNCAALGWGGYRNGYIPLSAMRYSPVSQYMHAAASLAFDELYAAGQAAGFDLRAGEAYRPASAGGGTSGRSCHGVGLAADITVLVDGDHPAGPNARPTGAFLSPEFTWMCANAERFNFVIPAFALPNGMQCGGSIGTGRGGWRGNRCCFLEPWHWEAAGVALTHPDFAGKVNPPASPRRRRRRGRCLRHSQQNLSSTLRGQRS